jgi:hypothetical protein
VPKRAHFPLDLVVMAALVLEIESFALGYTLLKGERTEREVFHTAYEHSRFLPLLEYQNA